MTAQRRGFLKQREAGLRIELAAAERRLSEQVMRYEMIEGYLQALRSENRRDDGRRHEEVQSSDDERGGEDATK